MSDLFTDPKALALAIFGVLMSILAWIGKGYAKRIEHLERTYASKADIDQRHGENLERLDRIETAVTGTHRRIDDLYRDLMGKD